MVTASDQDIPRRNQWRKLVCNVLLYVGPLVRELTVPKLPPFRTFFIDNFFFKYIGYV